MVKVLPHILRAVHIYARQRFVDDRKHCFLAFILIATSGEQFPPQSSQAKSL
jgi:hypothetical protein